MFYKFNNNLLTKEQLVQAAKQKYESIADKGLDIISILQETQLSEPSTSLKEGFNNYQNVLNDITEKLNSTTFYFDSERTEVTLSDFSSESSEYQTALVDAWTQYDSDNDNYLSDLFDDSFYYSADAVWNRVHFLFPEATDYISSGYDDGMVKLSGAFSRFKDIYDAAETQADGIIYYHHRSSADLVSLNEGFCELGDLVRESIIASISPDSDDAVLNLPLVNRSGEEIQAENHIGISLSTVLSEMNASYKSAIVYIGGIVATKYETVADRVSAFTSYVSSRVSDAASSISSFYTYVTDKITNVKNKTVDYLRDFLTVTRWNEVFSQDTSDPQYPEKIVNSDVFKYTGVSPENIFNWGLIDKVATSTVRTVGFLIASVAKGIWNLFKKLLTVGLRWLIRNVVQGSDLLEINGGGKEGIIDNFEYAATTYYYFQMKSFYSASIGNILSQFTDVMNSLDMHLGYFAFSVLDYEVGDSFSYSNLAGETGTVTALTGEKILKVHVSWKFKPKGIDPECLNSILASAAGTVFDDGLPIAIEEISAGSGNYRFSLPSGSWTYEQMCLIWIETFDYIINLLQANSLGYISNADMDGKKMFGYLCSMGMMCTYFNQLNNVNENVYATCPITAVYSPANGSKLSYFDMPRSDGQGYVDWTAPGLWEQVELTNPSNIDFVKIASGYDQQAGEDPSFCRLSYSRVINGGIAAFPAFFIIGHIINEAINDYNEHSPVLSIDLLHNEDLLPEPQFSIMTDEQVAKAIIDGSTYGVLITVGVVLGVAAIVGIRSFFQNKYFNKASFIARMDAKMWDGKKLSWWEKVKYKWYSRKINNSNFLTKGIISVDQIGSNAVQSTTSAVYSKINDSVDSMLGSIGIDQSTATDDNLLEQISNKISK